MQDQIIAVPEIGEKTQAELSAALLSEALRTEHGIQADTHAGYDLAPISVWVGLVVWCDGEFYWWRAGWDGPRKRVLYARHPAVEPSRAARRIAFRYACLRERTPLAEVTGALSSEASTE